MNNMQRLNTWLNKHPLLVMPITIAICIPLLTVIYLISLAIPKTTYNQYFVDGIPVVNCKDCQNIPDLDDPSMYNKNRLLGHVSHGYCAESNYDIAIGNDISDLYQEITYLKKEIARLEGNK
ncbi:MAG: hypothetical protein WC516_08410 [Patescibacteria group bacterium]